MTTSWHAEGDYYCFANEVVSGKYLAAGHYQGMRDLVHRSTGVQIAAGETLPGLVAPYRVFGNGRRYGDVRDRDGHVEIVSDGLRITHTADAENPFDLVSLYVWQGDTLDIHYTITLHADMSAFELGVASYLAAGFRAFVCRQSNVWGETDSRIVPVDVNPMTDVYAVFPRSEADTKTVFDGRLDLPPYPVRFVAPAYFAQPLAYRRHASTGVMALGMADPKDCYSICIPVNNPPEEPDPANGYQGIYFYLFGRDFLQGDTVTTRLRWIIGRNMSDAEVLARWEAFASTL
jgi:hypothetical protein